MLILPERLGQRASFTLIMTEMCNLACKYCYVDTNTKNTVVSKEVMDALIKQSEEFLKLNPTKLLSIDLFGGEPLIAWEECKYIMTQGEYLFEKFQNRFYGFSIFTNLTLLEEEHLDWLDSYNNISYGEKARLHFSLDGSREAHDNTRVFKDGSGSFDLVMNKVELLRKRYPDNDLIAKSVVSTDNLKFLVDGVKELKELGFNRISNGPARNVWSKEAVEEYNVELQKLADHYISNIDDNIWYDVFSIPILDGRKRQPYYGFCGAGKGFWSISPEGDIYPCQRFFNSRAPYIMGNVLDGGIGKNNKWFKLFLNLSLDNIVGCSKCEDFPGYSCPWGSCLADNYDATGNMFVRNSSMCDVIKITSREAKRVNEVLKGNHNYQKTLDRDRYGG